MKILFLNLPYKFKISRTSRWPEKTKSGTFYYPYWLAYAAGVSQNQGFQIKLIDAVANGWDSRKTLSEILSFNPDILVGEVITPTLFEDLEFFSFCKKNGFLGKIAAVGTHITALPEETLRECSAIDFAAIGEYDFTIPDLARNISSPEKVLGIAWRENGQIIINGRRPFIKDLDTIPFVSKVYKEFLNVSDYFYSLACHPMIQILSARGCPFRCTFCSYPQTMEGREFRERSPENFVEELEYISKELPQIKEIFIEDDTFTVNEARVRKICDLIIAKKLNLAWSANVRANVSYATLEKMKKTGCRLLVVGYESGNQQILDSVKKGITLGQSLEFSKNTKKLGLKVFGCFMLGLPGETKETIKETFSFAKKVSPDMVFFQQAVPFPGTEFYQWLKENKFLITDDFGKWLNSRGYLECLARYPNLGEKEIERMRESLMLKYYLSPNFFARTLIKNWNFGEIKRLLRGAKSYFSFLLKKN